MYHRNKVHTDEFWKYELAKHRRNSGSCADPRANDDMWQMQLGKHAEEAARRANAEGDEDDNGVKVRT
jgi:hypothetical protein